MDQAAKYGYEGIEMFYEDIEVFASQLAGSNPVTTEHLLDAARDMRKHCDSLNLPIISLQPFSFYEGLLNREEHDRRIEKLGVWFRLVKALGTSTVQIPANFLPAEQLTGDIDVIVGDLAKVARLGLLEEPPVRFVYENLCWSTYIDTWEKAWDVVETPDLPRCVPQC